MKNTDIQSTINHTSALLVQARNFFEASHFDESERCASEVIALLENETERDDLGDEHDTSSLKYAVLGSLAHAYNRLNTISFSKGEYSLALKQAEIAIKLCDRNGNRTRKSGLLGNIGSIYNHLSDYATALDYMQMALAIDVELDYKPGIALHLGNIGSVYDDLADYTKALEYHQKSLSINVEIGRQGSIAINLCNIGNVYQSLMDYPKGLEYLLQALAINEALDRKTGIALNLGNIGNTYLDMSDYDKALEYHRKALAMNEALGRKSGIARNLGNMGVVYQNLSDYTNALEYMQKAFEINESLGLKEGVAHDLSSMGNVYANRAFEGYDARRAEEYLRKAMAISHEIGSKEFEYGCHKSLSDLYKDEKRWEEAHGHLEQFIILEKEVQSDEAKKQANLMEQRRLVEEREKQIAIAKAAADAKHQATEQLLHNVLPPGITRRLLQHEKPIADKADNVSVFFSDIVGFTSLSQKISAKELVTGLNDLFTLFDALAKKYNIEKIKTIGDAYMAVCGVPVAQVDHVMQMSEFAFSIQQLFHDGVTIAGHHISIRIGLHCGEVVAGVIGENKFAYDLWGDAVNTASRMESHGEAGKIHVSEDFMKALSSSSPTSLHFRERGAMEIKGKGKMNTYFMERK